MRSKDIIDLVPKYLRVALFVISIMAICSALIWKFAPAKVNQFGDFVLHRYLQKPQQELALINDLIMNKQETEAIHRLKILLESLSEIKKQDRLARIKRQAFEKIVTLDRRHSPEQAIYWLEQWNAFDDRDLNAQVQFAELLAQAPDHSTARDSVIQNLYQTFPNAPTVVEAYLSFLVEKDQEAEATRVAERYVQTRQSEIANSIWQIYWDSGNGFGQAQSQQLKVIPGPGAKLTLSHRIPLGPVVRVRIDPPANFPIYISNGRFTLSHNDSVTTLEIEQTDVKHNSFIEITSGFEILTHGIDPFFYIAVPAHLQNAGYLDVEFIANVQVAMPRPLNTRLQNTN